MSLAHLMWSNEKRKNSYNGAEVRLRCCGEGTTGFEFIAVWGGISRLYKFLCPSSAQTQVHHCRQPHHALKIMCATMEILLHLLTWRKWKCFYVKHMVRRLFMTRQKNLPKKGRSQGFLSSGGWHYFPTQIETFLAHTRRAWLSKNFNSYPNHPKTWAFAASSVQTLVWRLPLRCCLFVIAFKQHLCIFWQTATKHNTCDIRSAL